MCKRRFELLLRQAGGQNDQRLAQINHVIQAGSGKVFGGSVGEHQNFPETEIYWNSKWEF